HRQTLFTLGKLAALVTRLQQRGVDAAGREIAAEVLEFFDGTSHAHHEDEERHVFPRLLAGGDDEIRQAVLRLQHDHHWIEEDWLELRAQLDAIASGQSWSEFDLLREGVEIYTELLHDHMALEESYIYPQARAQVPSGQRREMSREMQERRRAREAKS